MYYVTNIDKYLVYTGLKPIRETVWPGDVYVVLLDGKYKLWCRHSIGLAVAVKQAH